MGKNWGSVRLDLAAYAAQVRHPALTLEQSGRLALAWPGIWIAYGGSPAPESEWRRAMGYGEDEWPIARSQFACALERDSGWTLPFMADEGARQAAVSASQSAKVGKRWNTAVSPGIPRNTVVYPASNIGNTNYTNTNSRNRKIKTESQSFVSFWEAYPRKIDRTGCAKLWASFKLDDEAPAVMAGLALWATYWTGRDPQYTPHPSTFLRQRRWESPPESVSPIGGSGKSGDDDGWTVTGPPHKWGAK